MGVKGKLLYIALIIANILFYIFGFYFGVKYHQSIIVYFVLLTLQIVIYVLLVTRGKGGQSDPAGNAMSDGYAHIIFFCAQAIVAVALSITFIVKLF